MAKPTDNIHKNPFDTTLEEDQDMKYEYQNNHRNTDQLRRKKRNRWITIGLATLLVASILSIAIAVPVSMMQDHEKSASKVSHINDSSSGSSSLDIKASSTNNITNITAASLPQKESKKSRNQNRILLTTDTRTSYDPPVYAHDVSPYSNLIRLKTFTPPDDGRIFVMGDIHGCLNEMNALLEKIDFQTNKDVLILTGDLVFRGQDSIGVIRRARELNALCVRGNHDDKVVRFRGYQNAHGIEAMSSHDTMPEGEVGDPLKFSNKHKEIARNMNVDDYDYLAGCPLILDIPDLEARVVHGGLDPSVENLINNDPWSVMNMRDIDSDNQPSKAKLSKNSPSSSNIHWTSAYQSYSEAHNLNVTVYYGHDASRGIALGTKTIGVDSGCVYGRKLSAIEMRTQKLFQVDCASVDEDKETALEN